jgi:hypothetical protein
MYKLSDVKQLNWEDLLGFEYELHVQISSLHIILREQENLIKKLRKKFKSEVLKNPQLKHLKDEDYAAMYDWLFSYSESILDQFYTFQRQSIIATIFSFLETFLKEICEFIERKFKQTLSIEKHKNNKESLTMYLNFLIHEFKIDIKQLEPIFTKIKQEQLIRNKIVHQGGYYDKSEKKLPRIGNGLKTSDLGDTVLIKIPDDKYSKYLLKLVTDFTDELVKAIDLRYGEIVK